MKNPPTYHHGARRIPKRWLGAASTLLLRALILYAFGSAAIHASEPSRVFINEFMASNGLTIADEDGDYEDWIEIFNADAASVSLGGYGLSDDPDQPFRWVFPDVGVPSGGYLLVWASGKDRAQPGHPLHASFSISAGGEPLVLTRPDNSVADHVPAVSLPRDISYGRQPDGGDTWYYFDQPTPGAANVSPGYAAILDPPAFSRPGGFYLEPFDLTLSSATPEADIVFTLDGSLPDPDNLDGRTYSYKNQFPRNPGDPFGEFLTDTYRSYLYTEPLHIRNRAADPDKLTGKSSTYDQDPTYFPPEPVFKGTVVRARTVKYGALPSPTATHTFFVMPEGRGRYTLPVACLSIQEDALFDYEHGIYTAGVGFDTWRAANPETLVTGWQPANWRRATEFPAHFEWFEPASTEADFRQALGFRIHGGATRSYRAKTLRLYARAEYSASELNHRFFPDLPHNCFRRLLLRNFGNDFISAMLRDAAIQTMVAPLRFDTQAYRQVVVFVNGEYWGLHNLRERYDKHYLSRVYGVDADNLDLLNNNAYPKEGDAVHYNQLRAYMDAHDIAESSHYGYVQTQMDIDNFIDYQIAQIFARNTDWPGNNIDYWRLRTDGYQPNARYGHDGRWRWLMYDTDFGFGWRGGANAYRHNTLAFATQPGGTSWPNPDWSTFVLRTLLRNETFRLLFINRFADLLNTIFLPDRTVDIISRFRSAIEPEMAEHIERWQSPGSIAAWESNVQVAVGFANQRPAAQRQHIVEYFDLPGMYRLQVDVSEPQAGYVRVNTVELLSGVPGVADQPYPWEGIYFQGIPISLEAVALPGHRFVGWDGLPQGTEPQTVQVFLSDTAVGARFEATAGEEPVLLHYWHFNDLPPGALGEVEADHTVVGGASLTYPGTGDGFMDRVDPGSLLNAREAFPAGYGLRVRNPSDTRAVILNIPTVGHDRIVLRYAAHRTVNGATEQALHYRTGAEGDWVEFDGAIAVGEQYAVYTFPFFGIAGAEDNPHFGVRIMFGGTSASGSSGNNRFDNITVDGMPLNGANAPPVVTAPLVMQELVAGDEPWAIDLAGFFADPDGDDMTFTATSDDETVLQVATADSVLTITGLYQGEAWITVSASDGHNDPVSQVFRALVYPAAHPLRAGAFAFAAWDPLVPERVYPDSMLFLQSDVDDPHVDTALLHPYFIPHDDYHADDSAVVGFPYAATRRTRLTGLGEDGIALINTGRGRDLGGALVALDTREVSEVRANWLAGTLLRNSRVYAIRLQYRVGLNEPFADVLADDEPVEYLAAQDGDLEEFIHIALPPAVSGQPYVQLLWRYHHVSGDTGSRSELRLDDIAVDAIGAAGGIHMSLF